MIQMTYKQISEFDFARSVQKLAQMPFNPQTAYRIKKLVDDLNTCRKKIHEEYMKDIQGKYAVVEDGKVKMGPDGQGFEVAEDKRDEFEKAQEAFGERPVTINRNKLSLGELMNTQFSASEMSTLEPILEIPEEANVPVTPTENVRSLR